MGGGEDFVIFLCLGLSVLGYAAYQNIKGQSWTSMTQSSCDSYL